MGGGRPSAVDSRLLARAGCRARGGPALGVCSSRAGGPGRSHERGPWDQAARLEDTHDRPDLSSNCCWQTYRCFLISTENCFPLPHAGGRDSGPTPPIYQGAGGGASRRCSLGEGPGGTAPGAQAGCLSARARGQSSLGGSGSQPQVWPPNVPESSLRSWNLETLTDSLRRTDHNYRMNHMQLTEDLTQIFMRRAKNTPRCLAVLTSSQEGGGEGAGSCSPAPRQPRAPSSGGGKPTHPACHPEVFRGLSVCPAASGKPQTNGPAAAQAASLSLVTLVLVCDEYSALSR